MLQRVLCSLSLLTLAISTAHAAEALDTPRLAGMDNFRDIAGTTSAYTTSHDGTMRAGVFYRSNALTPTAADLATLNGLGISDVYDLRTPSEIASTPDTLPDGASYTNIDIIGSTTSGSNITNISFSSAEQARAMMQETNRAFVNDASMRGQFAVLFNELAAADGAALFHCTAGKDRTGWTAAVLLSIAGVDEATIMSNYLATNDYTAARVAATLAAMPASMAEIYAPLLGVEASYLQAGLDEISADYGNMENYLKQGLGLSQETIYVLRGKMVRYGSLPGEAGLLGNAAAGAQLLRELQDTPLSGSYSAYNYYLQSAIDAGTLGGVTSTVGGQVHADAASYLLRQGAMVTRAASPFTDASNLKVGQARLWSTALAGYLGTDGSAHAASSNEHSQGLMVGMTQRFSEQLSGHAGFGYNRGNVGGAGGEADTDLTFLSLGARFAPGSLEHGLFIDADISGGWLDYSSKRELGGGLGTAKGDSHGTLAGASLALGYRLPTQGVVLEPSLGVRVSHVDLNGFTEKGSELALQVDDLKETRRSAVANLKASFAPIPVGSWRLVPGVEVGYEHALGDQQVDSQGHLLGLDIEQRAAFDNRDQFTGGVSLMAHLGALSVGGEVAAMGGGDSHGVSGSLKASYAF
ncbi:MULTISPECIES: tyrosine-protein phosphatase [Pseudomonas]|uniref:Autotransporter domain-containing protein n=1 Tax=Pseudomonas putida NBRC 14164 TaxID=1211579 RepID=A0ABM7EHG2_PSEPU|nr:MULTISPECIES: tyrosine-protein phosphatase [Pseudomonas]EKT4461045.1 tyrosine-protein phosphatase [Pseudomonas putida]EKT4558353.1 tyrosine-protein phosphatase [Pseudomonas putida]MCX9138626.1 tyrosine-protein phosphatase [Pseudomonas sp. DCB_PUT]MDD1970996.1 tyrosine-protein phosphatase [Pseudomonas putida]MDO1461478.1 autotransporter domain-containing protein [Pseudomonas putida]